jgi:hypothetical protein
MGNAVDGGIRSGNSQNSSDPADGRSHPDCEQSDRFEADDANCRSQNSGVQQKSGCIAQSNVGIQVVFKALSDNMALV